MTDVAELRATLERLQRLLPLVPPRFGTLAKHAGEIKQKASALLESITQADAQAEAFLGQIDLTIRQLADDSVKNREALAAGFDQLAQGLLELDAVDKTRDVLEQSADAASAVMESLTGRLDDGVEAMERTADGIRAALDELRQESERDRRVLSAALEASAQAAETLRQAVTNGERDVSSAIEELSWTVRGLQTQAEERVPACLSATATLRQTFTSRIDGAMQSLLEEPADALIRETKEKLAGQLQEHIDAAVGDVTRALAALAQTANGAEEGARASRERVQPLFDRLQGSVEPITTAVDAIQDAAITVGIDV